MRLATVDPPRKLAEMLDRGNGLVLRQVLIGAGFLRIDL